MPDSSFIKAIINLLESEGIKNSAEQAKVVGISPQKFKEFFIDEIEKTVTPIVAERTIKGLIDSFNKKDNELLTIDLRKELMNALLDSLKLIFKDDYFEATGLTLPTETNWRNGSTKPQQNKLNEMMEKIDSYYNRKFESKSKNLIRTIYNFERIYPEKVEKTVWRIHKQKDGTELKEIRDKLTDIVGVYLLYDSSGRLVYVGKTEKQDLYSEITQRLRTKQIKLVLTNRKRESVLLGEIVNYLTCYEIADKNIIGQIEALLIGSDPNTFSNIKMEN